MLVCGMYETDIDVLDKRRVKAWETACGKFKKSIDNYPFKLSHMQNMNDRLVSWRTHAANYVRDKAAAKYFPKTNPMTSNELKAHIEWLKARGLHAKPDSAPGEGYFQHPLIQTCMEEMVFQFKKDIGVQFPDLFWQPSAELICFFCAILQFVVEEREIGKTGKADLKFKTQQKAYNTHLTSHGVWLERARPRWALIQKQLFLCGLKFSDNPDPAELAAWEEEMAELTSKKHKDPEGWGGLDYDEASGQDQLENANKLEQPLVHTNKVMRSAFDNSIQEQAHYREDFGLQGSTSCTYREDHPYRPDTNNRGYRPDQNENLCGPVPLDNCECIPALDGYWQRHNNSDNRPRYSNRRQDYNRFQPRYNNRELSLENHERSNYSTGHQPNNVYTRTRQDRDEYAHFNQIEDCPPNLYWDFGIKPTSGSNYGDDHDENGDAHGTPKRMIETSFGEDYPAEFNGEY
ncbi:hypothetical protein RhiXN_09356 [Rhizoctonia solani]|uniref:DUF6532 domain-containing protein n=1 Tax=Rhizoctonia solani TaxID=456999 RepID=A0A8H8SVV9_9AGAM|nr:uncharacterized protein RhiXN_09356 [Rhizoctonia solani]QRW20381.1 hypothetical protein RhiXN_09356 [Rhizoctonia solani]